MEDLGKLVGSQVFTRLATFGLNQIITRSLSVEVFGLLAIKFHLINATILMLSREGVRRGSMRTGQETGKGVDEVAVLKLSSLTIPLGALVTAFTCWFFWPAAADANIPGYQAAILLQGAAGMLELLSEPLYVLAQVHMRIGVRVRAEAAATLAKIGATLLLLWLGVFTEAVALSVAQGAFAAVLLLGYLWHFWPYARQALSWRPAKPGKATDGRIQRQDLVVCANFTGQAFEKLVLAEGTKVVVAKVQDAYDQGVYGLVVNLGSVVVRTLFQPFEEAAFMAFSRQPGQVAARPLATLLPLLRVALLCGLLATSFGPSNTFLLLHLLYGRKYSGTEAPAALALYCPYILLLAANGILESFVHAVARGPELLHGHAALLVITGLQAAATLALAASRGTLGMIAADSLGMLLRIAYCCVVIRGHTRRERSPGSRLADALPSPASLLVLAVSAAASSMSAAALLEKGVLAGLLPSLGWPFWRAAGAHVVLESIVLAACLLALYRTEQPLWGALQRLRRKQD